MTEYRWSRGECFIIIGDLRRVIERYSLGRLTESLQRHNWTSTHSIDNTNTRNRSQRASRYRAWPKLRELNGRFGATHIETPHTLKANDVGH